MTDTLTRRHRPLSRDERGTAIVETALTLPLLLLVSIGIFEFGRAYQTWQVLTNAAREGARIAVLPGITDEMVSTRVTEYLDNGAIGRVDEADVSIVRDEEITLGAGTASGSRVTVTYPYEFMVLEGVAELVTAGTTVGEGLTMSATALMRNEQ
jgi:Flp pilus assembly protein TadG